MKKFWKLSLTIFPNLEYLMETNNLLYRVSLSIRFYIQNNNNFFQFSFYQKDSFVQFNINLLSYKKFNLYFSTHFFQGKVNF